MGNQKNEKERLFISYPINQAIQILIHKNPDCVEPQKRKLGETLKETVALF